MTTKGRKPVVTVTTPVDRYLETLSPSTRSTMKSMVKTLVDLLAPGTDSKNYAWHKIRASHFMDVSEALASRRNLHAQALTCLRGVLHACREMNLIDEATYKGIVPPVRVVKRLAQARQQNNFDDVKQNAFNFVHEHYDEATGDLRRFLG